MWTEVWFHIFMTSETENSWKENIVAQSKNVQIEQTLRMLQDVIAWHVTF